MQFVNPAFLFGLLALSIPVIIHLFNFRRFRKVWFTNVTLLEEFTQKTRRESKIRHLIVLILRLLAITCIVFAFAQPYFPDKKSGETAAGAASLVSIYIDNSFSMESGSDNGALIDKAKKKAVEIASSFKTGDLFNLITNDFEGKHQRFVSRDEFIEMAGNVNVSSSVRSLSEIIQRQVDVFQGSEEEGGKYLFLISDFQKSVCDFEKIRTDSSYKLYAVPVLPAAPSNIFIDSAWLSSPVLQVGQSGTITATIRNISEADVEKVPLKMSVNGSQRAVASVDIKAGGVAEINMNFSVSDPGIQQGFLEIADSPVNYDDKLFFSFTVRDKIPVLSIYGKNNTNYLNSLFGRDSAFTYNSFSEKMIDYNSFTEYSLIILDGVEQISTGLAMGLKKFVENGGSLVVFPAANADLNSYNTFLSSVEADNYLPLDTLNTKVTDINLPHQLFNDVFEKIPENMDLPVVLNHYPLKSSLKSGREVLLKMQNGNSFLSVTPYNKGKIYLTAVSLDASFGNFPRHALFVPAMYRMALLVDPERSLYYFTGRDEVIPVKNSVQGTDMVFKIRKSDDGFEIVPGIREAVGNVYISTYGQIKDAGNYSLVLDKDIINSIAFNYDRRESVLEYLPEGDIADIAGKYNLQNFTVVKGNDENIAKTLVQLRNGTSLWKMLVLLALVFLGAEVLMLRIGK